MGAGISVTVSGNSQFEAYLRRNVAVSSKVVDVVKKNGATLQTMAQQRAPVDTGFLKRNINLNFSLQSTMFTAIVSSDAEYAPYQEYGTRFQPGTPHIRPAFYEVRPVFISDIERLVRSIQ